MFKALAADPKASREIKRIFKEAYSESKVDKQILDIMLNYFHIDKQEITEDVVRS